MYCNTKVLHYSITCKSINDLILLIKKMFTSLFFFFKRSFLMKVVHIIMKKKNIAKYNKYFIKEISKYSFYIKKKPFNTSLFFFTKNKNRNYSVLINSGFYKKNRITRYHTQKKFFSMLLRRYYSKMYYKLLNKYIIARRNKYFVKSILNNYLSDFRICTLVYNNSYKNVFLTLLSDKGQVLHTHSSGCIGFIGKKRTYELTIKNLTTKFFMEIVVKLKGYICDLIVSTRGSLLN